jgi:molybdate transport system substrate-binding protein
MASDKVEVIETLPESSHPPIRYPAAVLAGSTHADAAAFLAFLSSDKARQIFTRHGFGLTE